MKKIVLVGQMMASTNGFRPLEQELKKRGMDVKAYLPAGKPLHDVAEEIFESAGNVDLILTGMSSEQNLVQEEVQSLELAIARKIPCGVYADTFGVHRRTWFKHLREKINFLFVTNKEEAKDAKTIYPNTNIIVSGNPTREAYFTPVWTYEQSREILGIAPDEIVALCPQGKNLVVNREHIGGTIQAIESVFITTKDRFRVFVCLHPGDLNPLESYADFLKSSVKIAFVTKNMMRSSVLVPASDIIIESGSDIGVEACCQRKPVISFFTKTALDRLDAGKTGGSKWPPCELGAQKAVYGDITELASVISELLTPEGYAPMRVRQEKVFPQPAEKGSATKIMADTIEKYLS